jgi:hypothetical protein
VSEQDTFIQFKDDDKNGGLVAAMIVHDLVMNKKAGKVNI